MLTNNGKAFLYARNYDGINNSNTQITLHNTEASPQSYSYIEGNNYSFYTCAVQSLIIVVGSSTVPPNVSDCNLKNPISDVNLQVVDRSCRNYSIREGSASSPIIMSASATYLNTKNENWVINEIGLYTWIINYGVSGGITSIYDNNQYSKFDWNKSLPGKYGTLFLLAREVLNNPVTIAPGETATFSITVA